MRAIIKCTIRMRKTDMPTAALPATSTAVPAQTAATPTEISAEQSAPIQYVAKIAVSDRVPYSQALQGVMRECDLWPALPQDHPEVRRVMQDILDNVADSDKPVIAETIMFAIWDAETNTYGIVNQTGYYTVEFRLKNPVSDKLKKACTDLVRDLRDYVKRSPGEPIEELTFSPRIEVLEPRSQHQALTGFIGEEKSWKRAKEDRRPSYILAIITTILFLFCLWITSPLGYLKAGEVSDGSDWQRWAGVLCSHASPAALVTACISWLEVGLHWKTLKTHYPIDWRGIVST